VNFKKTKQIKEKNHKILFQQIIFYECDSNNLATPFNALLTLITGSFKNPNFQMIRAMRNAILEILCHLSSIFSEEIY
jgi:hypothetical protein